MRHTLSGAYGRDYTSKAKVLQAWEDNLDFRVRSLTGSGYVNREDIEADEGPGVTIIVNVRYAKDRRVAVLSRRAGVAGSPDKAWAVN